MFVIRTAPRVAAIGDTSTRLKEVFVGFQLDDFFVRTISWAFLSVVSLPNESSLDHVYIPENFRNTHGVVSDITIASRPVSPTSFGPLTRRIVFLSAGAAASPNKPIVRHCLLLSRPDRGAGRLR
jgi:hypothetical protein